MARLIFEGFFSTPKKNRPNFGSVTRVAKPDTPWVDKRLSQFWKVNIRMHLDNRNACAALLALIRTAAGRRMVPRKSHEWFPQKVVTCLGAQSKSNFTFHLHVHLQLQLHEHLHLHFTFPFAFPFTLHVKIQLLLRSHALFHVHEHVHLYLLYMYYYYY